ncbi:hypothetical protein F511_05105 [Dorcoceras hygrometricum]|uniref:Uncharacterized protein n=1 Tax=Dorcoceras hygrometricum TaxID=472368 RepID=A0A2Z7BAL2_9LAMI|nr:hypothetical protein F511_05105 [Dorcoceras hygrometricum]
MIPNQIRVTLQISNLTLNRVGTYPNDVAPKAARSLGHIIALAKSESLNGVASHPHQNTHI